MEDIPLTTPTPKGEGYQFINIATSLENGLTLADIAFDAKESGLPVHGPTIEKLMERDPRFKDKPELAAQYVALADNQTRMYNANQYDPNDRTGIVLPDTPLGNLMAKQWDVPVVDPTYKPRTGKTPDTGILLGNEGLIQTNTGDEVASSRGVYIDKNGGTKPLYKAEKEANHLYRWQSPEGDTFWKEAQDNEYIQGDLIRGTFDRKLESDNIVGVGLRNMWYGFGPLMVKGAGAAVGTIGSLTDQLVHNDLDYVDKDAWYYKFNINRQNWGNSHMTQNIDEQQGLFDSWTSFTAQILNGVGQMFGMVAVGAATAGMGVGVNAGLKGLGLALPNLGIRAGMAAGLGKIGVGTKVAKAIAGYGGNYSTQLSLLAGDMQSMSMFQNQMLDAGMDYAKATRYAVPFAIATHLSESIIPYDEALGGKIIDKMVKKGFSSGLTKKEAKEALVNAYGKKITDIPLKEMSDATKNMMAKNAFNNMIKGKQWLVDRIDGKKLSRIITGSFLEGGEEIVEGALQSQVAAYVNGTMGVWASKFDNTFGNMEILPNENNGLWQDGDGKMKGSIGYPYKMVDRTNPSRVKLITQEEATQFLDRKMLADNILNGKQILSTSVNLEEGIAAFISTALATSMLGSLGLHGGARKATAITLAQEIAKDPNARTEIEKSFVELVKEGVVAKNFQTKDGEIIKNGDIASSEAGEVVSTFMADVDRYTELIKKYEIDSPKTKYAIGGLDVLAKAAINTVSNIEYIDQAIKDMAEGKKPVKNALYKKGVTPEELAEQRKGLVKYMSDIVEPKILIDKDGKEYKAERSLKYTELWLRSELYDYGIEKLAEKKAREDTQIPVTDPNYQVEFKKNTDIARKTIEDNIKKGLLPKFGDIARALYEYDHQENNSFVNLLQQNIDQHVERYNQELTTPRQNTLKNMGESVTKMNTIKDKFFEDLTASNVSLTEIDKLMKGVMEDISSSSIAGLSLEDVKSTIDQGNEFGKQILSLLEGVGKRDAILDPYEDMDLAIALNDSKKRLGSISETLNGINNVQRQEPIQSINDLPAAEFEALKVQMINETITRFPIPDLNGGNIRLEDFLAQNEPRGDNEYQDPQLIGNIAMNIIEKLNVLKGWVELNREFFQEKVEAVAENKEHTQLHKNQERLAQSQQTEVLAHLNDYIEKANRIKEAAGLTEESRELENAKTIITNMGVEYAFFRYIYEIAEEAVDSSGVSEFKIQFEVMTNFLSAVPGVVKNAQNDLAFDNLYNIYSKSQGSIEKNQANRALLNQSVIYPLFKMIADINDSLCGKTGTYARKFAETIIPYGSTPEFVSGVLIDKNAPGIAGSFTSRNYDQGKTLSGMLTGRYDSARNDVQRDQRGLFEYYTLTKLERLSMMGEKGKGKTFSYSEYLQAFRDMTKQMSAMVGVDGIYPSTFEQIKMINHLLAFSFKPDNSWIDDSVKDKNGPNWRVPNAILARGYTGVGKSTQVIAGFIHSRFLLTGNKKQRVVVVAPTKSYQNQYTKLQSIIADKLEDGKFTIITEGDMLKNGIPECDTVIIEEASNYEASSDETQTIETNDLFALQYHASELIKKNPNAHLLLLGDNIQTPAEGNASVNHSYFHEMGEKTDPITMMHRVGLVMFADLLSSLRNSIGKSDITFADTGWSQVPGKRIGIWNNNTEDEVIREYIEYTKDQTISEDKAILVVYNKAKRQEILNNPEYKFGLERNADNIKVAVKPEDRTEENEKMWVSGMNSERVYYAIDAFNVNNTQLYPQKGSHNYTLQLTLTSVGRVSGDEGYVSWVRKDTENKEKTLTKFQKNTLIGLSTKFDELNNFMDVATAGESTYTDKLPKESTPTIDNSFYRDAEVVDLNGEIEGIRQQGKTLLGKVDESTVTDENRVPSMLWDAKNKKRLDALKLSNETKENIDEEIRLSTERRYYAIILRKMFMHVLTPTEVTIESIIQDVKNYNENAPKEKTIPDPEMWLYAIRNSLFINTEIDEMIKGDSVIMNPVLQDESGLTGHPLFLNVVGSVYNPSIGGSMPIVDIYDVTYNAHDVSKLDVLKLKNGAYANMLREKGFQVNRVRVINIEYHGTKGITALTGITTLDDKDMIQSMTLAGRFFGQELTPLLVTKQELFHVAHENPTALVNTNDPTVSVEVGSIWKDISDGKTKRINMVATSYDANNKQSDFVEVSSEGESIYVPYEEFIVRFEKISTQYIDNLFKSSAERIVQRGEAYSSTTALVGETSIANWGDPSLGFPLQWTDDNDYYNHEKNRRLVIQGVILQHIHKGEYLEKQYIPVAHMIEVDNKGKVVNKNKTGKHVVVNVILKDQRDEIFSRSIDEINRALGTYENHKGKPFTREEFDALNYWIVSADSAVEYDFKKGTDDAVVKFFDNPVLAAKVEPYINGKSQMTDEQLTELFADSFKSDKSPDIRSTLIKANVMRLKTLRFINDQQKEGNKVFRELKDITPGNPVKFYAPNGSTSQPLSLFIEKGKTNDFTVEPISEKMVSDGKRKRFKISVKRDSLDDLVDIWVDAQTFRENEDPKDYISQLNKELDDVLGLTDFKERVSILDEYLGNKTENEKNIKTEFIKLMEIVERSSAHKFLMINSAYLQKSKKIQKFLTFKKGHIRLNTAGIHSDKGQSIDWIKAKIRSIEQTMKVMESDIRNNKDKTVQFYKTPFESMGNIPSADRLSIEYSEISHPSLFIDINDIVTTSEVLSETNKTFKKKNLFMSVDPLVMNNSNFIPVADLKAQIESIIGGDNLQKVIDANSFLSFDKIKNGQYGSAFYGRLHNAMMQFAVSDGMVNPIVGRHESMHYIIDFLLTPEARTKILTEAKQMMAKKTGILASSLTDRQAHEFIAGIYQDKSYTKIVSKTSLLKRFGNWLMKTLLPKWSKYKTSLSSLLYGADNGEYVNSVIQNQQNYQNSYTMSVENSFNSVSRQERVNEIFFDIDNVESVKQNVILSWYFTEHSNFTKNMSQQKKSAIQIMMDMYNHFKTIRNEEESSIYTITTIDDQGNKVYTDITIKELADKPLLYMAMKNARTVEGELLKQNEEVGRIYEIYHLGDWNTFWTMSQGIMKNVDLELLQKSDGKNFESFAVRLFHSGSHTDSNPIGTRSQTINLLLNNIPLWHRKETGGWEKYRDGNKVEYCNAGTLGYLLLRASIILRSNNKQFTLTNWFSELQKMEDAFPNGIHKNLIHSFLLEIGPESVKHNRPSELFSENRDNSFDNIGYAALVNDFYKRNKNFMDAYIKEFGTGNQVDDVAIYRERIKGFEHILSSLKNNYESIYNYMARRYDIDNTNNITETKLSGAEAIFEKMRIRNAIENTLYTTGDTSLNRMIYEKITNGKNQEYEITEDGVYRTSGKNFQFNTRQLIIAKHTAKQMDLTDALDVIHFLGAVDVTLQNLEQLWTGTTDKKKYDDLQSHLFYAMQSLKVNAMVYDHIRESTKDDLEWNNVELAKLNKENATDQLNYLTNGMYSSVMDFWGKKHYKVNSYTTIDNQNIPVNLPSPIDMYKFLEQVSDVSMYNHSLAEISTMYDVAGNPMYSFLKSSYFQDLFIRSFEMADANLGDLLKQRILPQLQGSINSPLIVGENFNNGFLNGKIILDAVIDIDGLRNGENGKKFEALSDVDKFKVIIGITKNSLLKGGRITKSYALHDTLSDSSHYPMMEFIFKDNGTKTGLASVSTTTTTGYKQIISGLTMDHEVLLSSLYDIENYYKQVAVIAQRHWNSIPEAKGKTSIPYDSPEGRMMMHQNINLKDYMIVNDENGNPKTIIQGRGITQPGNLMKGLGLKEKSGAKSHEIYYKIRNTFSDNFRNFGDMLRDGDYSMNVDDVALFGSYKINDDLKKLHGVQSDSIAYYDAKYLEQLEAINKSNKPLYEKGLKITKEISKKRQENKDKKTELNKKRNALYSDIAEDMAKNSFMQDGILHPILELVFWNNFIGNETMAHVTRGCIYDYKDINDYIKRSYGMMAPGETMSVSERFNHMGETSRVVYLDDVLGHESLFTDKDDELTNGFTLNSAVRDRMMFHDSGGSAGNLTHGTKKTVNSYYDHQSGRMVYHKHNEYPTTASKLRENRYYQEMNKMMLGESMYNDLMKHVDTEEHFIDHLDKILAILQTPEGQEYRKTMVDYVVHRSGVKTGQTRINQLETVDGSSKVTLDNFLVNPLLAADENVVLIKNNTLRFQTLQKQNPFGGSTFLPVQILHTVSAFENNELVRDNLDEIIGDHNKEFVNKVFGMGKDDLRNWIRQNAMRRSLGMNYMGKNISILNDHNIDINLLRKMAIQMFMNEAQENLRFKVPGAFHVQAPAMDRIMWKVDEDGNESPFLPSDLGDVNDGGEGYRLLQPQGYDVFLNGKWEKIESKKDVGEKKGLESHIADGSEIRFRPAEMIAAFHHKDKFGIDKNMSLATCMTYTRPSGTKASLYQKSTIGFNRDVIRKQLDRDFKGIGVSEILKSFVPKMRVVLDGFYTKQQEAINPDKGGNFYENKKAFVDFMADYYYNFNMALDSFIVRIPITESNMGSMARIVAFANDVENIAYISPLKNSLDDSDYDGDAVNVMYRPIELGSQEFSDVQERQRVFFDSINTYYSDKRNHKMILSKLSTKSLTQYAEAMEANSTVVNSPSAIGTTIKMDRIIYDGNNLVGHFAKMNSVIHNMFSIDFENRQILFANSKMLSENANIGNTMNFITKLIQAATINAGLGGVLGRLNINSYTTPLIAGMIFAGTNQVVLENGESVEVDIEKMILDILNSEFIKRAVARTINSNNINNKYPKKLIDNMNLKTLFTAEELLLITPDQQEYYNTLKEKVLWGEQIRRLGDFYSLEGNTGSDSFDVINKVNNLQKYLGENIDDFMRNIQNHMDTRKMYRPVDAQIDYYRKIYLRNSKTSGGKMSNEKIIREAFNLPQVVSHSKRVIGYMQVLTKADKSIKQIFLVDQVYDNVARAIQDNVGDNEIFGEETNEILMDEIWKYMIGKFLDTQKITPDFVFAQDILGYNDFDFSRMDHRVDFAMMFPKFVNTLKAGKYRGNRFVKSLTKAAKGGDFPIIEITKSSTMDPSERLLIKMDFLKMSKNDQQMFRLYNMLIHGVGNRAGSLFNAMDNNIEKELSNYVKGVYISSLNIDEMAKAIIRKNPDFANEVKRDSKWNVITDEYDNIPVTNNFVNYINGTLTRQRLMEKEGSSNVISTNPYWWRVNTYSPDNTRVSLPKALPLDLNQLSELYREGYVTVYRYEWNETHNLESVNDVEPGNITKDFYPVNSGEAVLLDGKIVKVYKIDNNTVRYILPEFIEKTTESRISRESARMSSTFIETLLKKIQKVVPNVRIELVDNESTTAPSRNGIAYIYNGVLFINTDRIQQDTPIHEIGHIATMIMKSLNHSSYLAIRKEAIAMIDANTEDIKKIRKFYPMLSTEDFIDEVISNMAGWESEQAVKNQMLSWGTPNMDSKSIWQWAENLIKRLWDGFKDIVSSIFQLRKGVSLRADMRAVTIKEFAAELVSLIENGNVLSTISSEELSGLQHGIINYSVIGKGSLGSAKDFHSALYYAEDNSADRDSLDFIDAKKRISDNNGVAPIWFDPDETVNPSDEKIADIVKKFNERSRNIAGKVTYFLNVNHGEPGTLDIRTIEGEPDSVYKPNVENKLMYAMHYNKNTRYYRYSELKNNVEFKHLVNEDLISQDFDPIIAIEYVTPKETKVSIYDVTLDRVDTQAYSTVKSNMFTNVVSEKNAIDKGIKLQNTLGDFKSLYASMLATHLGMQKGITVNRVQVINMTTTSVTNETADMIFMNEQLRNIWNYKEVSDLFGGSLAELINPKNIKNIPQDYMFALQTFYMLEHKDSMAGLVSSQNKTTMEKILFAVNRLKYLQGDLSKKDMNEHRYTTEQLDEMLLLTEFIRQLRELPTVDNIRNQARPFDHMIAYMTDTASIGNENVQSMRKMVVNADQKAVNTYNKVMEPLKMNGGVFQWFEKQSHAGIKKYSVNVASEIFQDLMVRTEDVNGVTVNTGFIYWTTDVNEDNLWATQAQKLLAEDKLTQEMLDKGRQIVDTIEGLLVYNLLTQRQMESDSFIKSASKQKYEKSDAIAELFSSKSGYRKGMIPIMNKTVSELTAEGKFKDAYKKRILELTDIQSIYEETNNQTSKENNNMNILRDLFLWQFGIGKSEKNKDWGFQERTNRMLGLERVPTPNGVLYKKLVNADGTPNTINDEMSYDLEKIMNYFAMTTIRNGIFETEVLPVVNAMKILALNDQLNRDMDMELPLTFYDEYRSQAIEGESHKIKAKFGPIDVHKTVVLGSQVASALVMPLNVNIPIISLVVNGAYAYVEGLSNTLGDAWGADRGYYGAGHLVKATGLFFSDYHKVSQLMSMFHLVSMNPNEMINLKLHQKTKKSVFNQFYMNWMNWATDSFARGIVMVAQMIHDGTYDAYTYDKESGKVIYDPKLDKRLEWDGTKFSDKGLAYMKFLKDRHLVEGIAPNGDLPAMGYSMEETRLFKTLGDKYVVGAYDHKTQSLIGNYLVGRMFLMFKRWMITRINNAVGEHTTLEEGGRVKMIQDEEGNWIPEWQRIEVEGYVNTILRNIGLSYKNRDLRNWANLKGYEKYNVSKALVNLGMFTLMFGLYGLLVSGPDDEDKDKPIPEIRLVKNFQYAYQSLLLIPMLVEMTRKPFALIDILGRWWKWPFDKFDIANVPFGRQVESIIEPFQEKDTLQ